MGAKVVIVDRLKRTIDATGILELAGGRSIEFPPGRFKKPYLKGRLWESERVRVVARKTPSGPWLGLSVTGLDTAPLGGKKPGRCVSLRIAPAQDFSAAKLVLHPADGYVATAYGFPDMLQLEEGAGFAASPVSAAPKCAGAKGRWSLEIKISDVTIAPDLGSGDAPVLLALKKSIRRLEVNERFQGSNCPPGGSSASSPKLLRRPASRTKAYPCPAVVVSTVKYHMLVFEAGSYATAAYSETVFDEPTEASLQLAKVTGFSALHSTIASASFEANGYKQAGNQSTASLVPVHDNDNFLIRPESWYGAPLLFPLDTIGVDHLAGLVWPRVTGKRNGYPFRYRAKLPAIVTDLLPGCGGNDCFYRLPWAFPGKVTVGQGNGPIAFSHTGNQTYAFDFSMADKSTIYATRGGVVGDLVETNTMNFNPCADNNNNGTAGDEEDKKADGPTNYVRVDHTDGTYSYYAHVDTNSVVPAQGDTIKRGAQLAKVGNIGRSCGPHLHYQVSIDNTNTLYGQTKQICFEGFAAVIFDWLYSPCFIPKTKNVLISTNG